MPYPILDTMPAFNEYHFHLKYITSGKEFVEAASKNSPHSQLAKVMTRISFEYSEGEYDKFLRNCLLIEDTCKWEISHKRVVCSNKLFVSSAKTLFVLRYLHVVFSMWVCHWIFWAWMWSFYVAKVMWLAPACISQHTYWVQWLMADLQGKMEPLQSLHKLVSVG